MAPTPLLDDHCNSILQDYREKLPVYEEAEATILSLLKNTLKDAGIHLASIESRIKSEGSLAGKLEKKGSKYYVVSAGPDTQFGTEDDIRSDKVEKKKND